MNIRSSHHCARVMLPMSASGRLRRQHTSARTPRLLIMRSQALPLQLTQWLAHPLARFVDEVVAVAVPRRLRGCWGKTWGAGEAWLLQGLLHLGRRVAPGAFAPMKHPPRSRPRRIC